eukprot:superscaffoldBa00000346_g3976
MMAGSGVYSSVVDPFLSHPYSFLFPQSLPHILYPHLSPCCLLLLLPTPLLFLQQTSLGLVQCLCSGFCVPRWQCVRKPRDTDGLGRAIGFQAQGQTFTFPNIFPEKDNKPEEGSMEEVQEKFMEDEKQRQKLDPRRGGVTEWFGL